MKTKLASLAALASMGLSAFAQESAGDTASGGVTIPESGVNIADYALLITPRRRLRLSAVLSPFVLAA